MTSLLTYLLNKFVIFILYKLQPMELFLGCAIVFIYSYLKARFDLAVGEKKECSFLFINKLAEKIRIWMGDSWKNKYKQVLLYASDEKILIPAPNTWYYRKFNLKYKERFPFSATLFVTFTDWYHFIWFLFTYTLIIGLWVLFYSSSYSLFLVFPCFLIINKLTFYVFYYKI